MKLCLVKLVAIFVAIQVSRAFADPGWLLTTADFQRRPVSLESIGADGVRFTAPEGSGSTLLDYSDFLQIDRASAARQSSARFVLILASGDRLCGDPLFVKDEQLTVANATIGEFAVALKETRALIKAGKSADNIDQPRVEDFVQLANGDSAKGVVTDITDSKLKINSGGADLELGLESIDYVLFATPAKPAAAVKPAATARMFHVRLIDDSVLSSSALASAADRVSLMIGGAKRDVPLAQVAGIEQLNGPVTWLSSLTPTSIVQIPYFGNTVWPTRMDQSVGGKPIQFGAKTYARGIGVHAYSKIEYALDGSYEAIRTQYAIATDEKRQYADVTVRIKVDDQVAHEQEHVKADVLSPVVVIELPKSAKRLTLEVDYGAANDTQDRFNWIEPALLRKKPTTRPGG